MEKISKVLIIAFFALLVYFLFIINQTQTNHLKRSFSSAPGKKLYGVNLSGGEFGPEKLPGVFNADYIYPTDEREYSYFQSKGFHIIRLPIVWERVQHAGFEPLYNPDILEIKKVLGLAENHNMKVIIDLHNFGRYYENFLTPSDNNKFSDLWTKLAISLKDEPGLYGYELMNEPHDLQGGADTWDMLAQSATNAIRQVDTKSYILVPGYNWQNAQDWSKNNQNLKIQDPSNKIIYTSHIYFDQSHNGRYDKSFAQERSSTNIGVRESLDFRQWLKQNNALGMFTEFGVPDNDPGFQSVMDAFLKDIQADPTIVGVVYWSAGPWWKDYRLSIEPRNGMDRPQMQILQKYIDASGN